VAAVHHHHHFHHPHFHLHHHHRGSETSLKDASAAALNAQAGAPSAVSTAKETAAKAGKMIQIAKIEFSTEAEKLSFIALVKEVQKSMVDIENPLY
jgi:hypothetical protein